MNMDWPSINHDVDVVALRGTKRDSMFLKAAVYCRRTDHRFDIVVRNISAGGLLADTPQALDIGEVVLVTLRKIGDVPGKIVWSQPSRFGIAFDVTIDPQDVRQPIKAPRKPLDPRHANIGVPIRRRRAPIGTR
jgi:PilZ domain